MPRAIAQLLEHNKLKADEVGTYILHQANLNLITRVAQALKAQESKFFCNLDRYGNTSSASMLIAAAEWWRGNGKAASPVVFSAFGAGLNWGALLALPC
jgi:3-oxoacyl-[acyl-carrier-protein] synthase-3